MPAAAQETRSRDRDGRVERGSDGTTRFYDSTGRNAGRAEPGSPGETRLYDRDGRSAGEIVQPPMPGGAWRPTPPRGMAPKRRD